jgi:hypothetical protein
MADLKEQFERISGLLDFGDLQAIPENKQGPVVGLYVTARDAIKALDEEKKENEFASGLIGRLTKLLTRTIEAIRGEPPKLVSWSHHDIPELVKELKDFHQLVYMAAKPYQKKVFSEEEQGKILEEALRIQFRLQAHRNQSQFESDKLELEENERNNRRYGDAGSSGDHQQSG